MWFEDKTKFRNLDDAILRVVNGQAEEQPETNSDEPIQQEEPSSADQTVLKENEEEIQYDDIKDVPLENLKKTIDEKRKSKHDYEIYHDTYSGAIQHAVDHTKKAHGYDVDQGSYEREVTFGQRKPSAGKTVIKKIDLHKDGKPANKRLQVQVHGMPSGKYELNKYVEDFNPNIFLKKDGIVEASKNVLDEANMDRVGKNDILKFAKQMNVPLSDVVHWKYGHGTEYIITLKGGSQVEYTDWDDMVKIPKSANPNMKVMRQYLANRTSIEGDKGKVADVKLGKNYLIRGLKAGMSMLGK
tara:strand:- start:377 stop:1273 length:897 start_codon:yes stop_codon:yes gene_type:complete